MKIKRILVNKKVVGFYCPKCKQRVNISKPFSYCFLCALSFKDEFIKEVLK